MTIVLLFSLVMLGWETMLLGHYMTECRDEIDVEDHWGTILGRFTCRSMGSWEGPTWESESQIGGLGRETQQFQAPI